MKLEYKITEYCENNHLFDSEEQNGIHVSSQDNSILITGSSRDLVELADVLVNVALSKSKNEHIHVDSSSIIHNNSEIPEMIIERK